MKSNLADLSVRNSGLNTIFKFLFLSCRNLVVPGVTVDLIKIILSFCLLTLEIFFNASVKISIFIEPSSLEGVGTERKINSDLLQTIKKNKHIKLILQLSLLLQILQVMLLQHLY